jgi:hypothetical protein
VERIVQTVKEGGAIDYEEYFDRTVVGTATTAGHYAVSTGFGNYGAGGFMGSLFGSGTYLCRSGNAIPMGTGGCFADANLSDAGLVQTGKPQRYGEYARQFANYNSDSDPDLGDSDGNGNIMGDSDDEDLGTGPVAFPAGTPMKELYLVKKNGAVPERLILRRTVVADPAAPAGAICDIATGSGAGCLGRLEMLRLVGRDYGEDHDGSASSKGAFDGVTDTWECRSDFRCLGPDNTPTGAAAEWVSVLPDDVNVLDAEFFPSPNKDPKLAWKEIDNSVQAAPQVRIVLSLGFSWDRRKKTSSGNPRTNLVTTVSLSP